MRVAFTLPPCAGRRLLDAKRMLLPAAPPPLSVLVLLSLQTVVRRRSRQGAWYEQRTDTPSEAHFAWALVHNVRCKMCTRRPQ